MKKRVGKRMPFGNWMLIGSAVLAAQNSPRVGLLEQEGWAAIKAGDHETAIVAFREGIRLDPKNARLR